MGEKEKRGIKGREKRKKGKEEGKEKKRTNSRK